MNPEFRMELFLIETAAQELQKRDMIEPRQWHEAMIRLAVIADHLKEAQNIALHMAERRGANWRIA